MMKLIKGFFLTLGVIFFLLIVGGLYLYVADPFGIKPLINTFMGSGPVEKNAGESGDNHPALNEDQEQALESFGVDTSALPNEISAEQEACFYDALGEDRANEIKAGVSPTATDYFKARHCLE